MCIMCIYIYIYGKAADTSGDGVIDREEWDTAVDGLEDRLPPCCSSQSML